MSKDNMNQELSNEIKANDTIYWEAENMHDTQMMEALGRCYENGLTTLRITEALEHLSKEPLIKRA